MGKCSECGAAKYQQTEKTSRWEPNLKMKKICSYFERPRKELHGWTPLEEDGSRWYLQSLHCCLPTSCLQCAHDVRRHDIMSTYQLPRWVTHRFTMTEDKLMQNGWREDTSCLLPHRCWTTFGRTLWGHPNHPRQRKAWQDSMEAMAAMACSRCLLADPVIGCQCDRVATQVIYTWDLARRRRKSTCWGKIQKTSPIVSTTCSWHGEGQNYVQMYIHICILCTYI